MDNSRAIHYGTLRRHHLPPAPPPILTGSTQWSFGTAELVRGRAGLPPLGGRSQLLGRDPLVVSTLPAGDFTGAHPSMVSPQYASQHAFVGSPRSMALDAAGLLPVDVLTGFGSLLRYDVSNHALWDANQLWQLQEHQLLAHEVAGPVHEDPETLIWVVNQVVQDSSSAGEWGDPAVRLAALHEVSSKHWQRLLAARDGACVANTLWAVLGFVFELMKGEFGHHLFQKLVSACRPVQLEVIVRAVAEQGKELVEAAKNKHGVRCVRQLLLAVKASRPMLTQLTTALSIDVAGLMMDSLGSGLIQRCLGRLSTEQNRFIYHGALANLKKIARNKYGCLALVQCINHAPASTKENFVDRIISSSACLSQDTYGNYLVQHIINLQDEDYTDSLCRKLKDHCLQLSMQKHGSHVVEKCIASTGRRHLLAALVSCKKPEQVAQDPYGNFVMQRALVILKQGEPTWYKQLAKSLMEHAQSLKLHPHGRHVFTLLQEEN